MARRKGDQTKQRHQGADADNAPNLVRRKLDGRRGLGDRVKPKAHTAPWQKGTVENTNGRLRRFLPLDLDVSTKTAEQPAALPLVATRSLAARSQNLSRAGFNAVSRMARCSALALRPFKAA
jgi:hypothetical protein